MIDLAYWGTMLLIPAGAAIVVLAVFLGGRLLDSRAAASEARGGHHTPAE